MTGDLVPTENWEGAELLPTIRHMCAKGATDPEWKIFVATARLLELNPMLKQIWCVKNENRPDLPAQIYASRDGFLAIAHRSGKFDGMQSGVKKDDQGREVGWCRIWRTDMSHPFEVEVLREEYDTKKNLWATKPQTMTVKVAEAHCLRRAFDICGVYTPEEMPEQGEAVMREVPDTSQPAPVKPLMPLKPWPKTSPTSGWAGGTSSEVKDVLMNAGLPDQCGLCGKSMNGDPTERITNIPGHGWRCLACRAALEQAEMAEAGA